MTERHKTRGTNRTARSVVIGLVVVLAAAAGYRWWSDPAQDAGGAQNARTSVEKNVADAPATQTQTPAQVAEATAAAQPGTPAAISTPRPPPATRSSAVAELAEQLGDYRDPGARRASRALVALGPTAATDVIAALRAVTRNEQTTHSAGAPKSELERLAIRKLQLIVVLGEIGGPEHADALVEAARASEPTSLAHQNVAIALGRMGASDAARAYAHEALANDDLDAVQARALLGQLAHFPSGDDQDIARKFMATTGPDLTRDLGLLLGARAGLKDEVAALAPSLVAVATNSERDFYTLMALAEALPPAEFERAVAGTTLGQARASRDYYSKALTHSRFYWGSDAEKEGLLRQQLTANQGELVIAGLKFVLESGRVDWLFDFGVVQNIREARRTAGLPTLDGDALKTAPQFARYVGFTGYRIDVSGDVPQIHKSGT